MLLLVVEKDKKVTGRWSLEALNLEEDRYTSTYAFIPSRCRGDTYDYSMECAIEEFYERLSTVRDYVLELVADLSPVAVVATPLPFKYPFIPNVFPLVEPYIIWLSAKPEHSPKTSRLGAWFFIIVAGCTEFILDYGAAEVLVYNALVVRNPTVYGCIKQFERCFKTFEGKVEVLSHDGGVLLQQRDVEAYRAYLKELVERIDELV